MGGSHTIVWEVQMDYHMKYTRSAPTEQVYVAENVYTKQKWSTALEILD
jgi:hypothetical protein